MSFPILNVQSVEALEARILARGMSLQQLIQNAVDACSKWIRQHYPKEKYPTVGLCVGPGHNGTDALGVGLNLLHQKRSVTALILNSRESLKPMTRNALESLEAAGATVVFLNETSLAQFHSGALDHWKSISVWIDGLHGFGLNRPLTGLHAQSVRFIQSLQTPIISIDIPSGLHGNVGRLSSPDPSFIRATETLALGCFKPVHFLESSLEALGRLHIIDLGYQTSLDESRSAYSHSSSDTSWSAIGQQDLAPLLQTFRRPHISHKYKSGRVLIIAGSKRYPGAGIMACLGASVSGVGMIHAWVPMEARAAILQQTPEVIFEKRLPDLAKFDAIVVGPGWVPGDRLIFDKICSHAQNHSDCYVVFDAGAFKFLSQDFAGGKRLNERCVLTPHTGEFAQLFPEPSARMTVEDFSQRMNSIEAAVWAAQMSGAHVYLKSARSCLASPSGTADVVLNSSSLLAHAGHGDVLAGLLGGLLARKEKAAKAMALAALLQSLTALEFSSQFPAALTLPPSELVRRLPTLLHH